MRGTPKVWGRDDHEDFEPIGLSAVTGAFVACPASLVGCLGLGQASSLELYRIAYEQARASLAPSILDRLRQVSWN